MNKHTGNGPLAGKWRSAQFSYYDTADNEEHVIGFHLRSLEIIVETLDDYAKLLARILTEQQPDGCKKAMYKIRARRCMEISDDLAKRIGLDKTYPKCKRTLNDDVGDDAMNLLMRSKQGTP